MARPCFRYNVWVNADTALADSDGPAAPAGPGRQSRAAVSGLVGIIAGLGPHLLHHVGLIASTALLAGTAGSAAFAALGLVVMLPMLLRLRRRFQSWLPSVFALAVFAALFAVSTLWIGPAVRGADNNPGHVHDPSHFSSH
jgi:hypothetical protein